MPREEKVHDSPQGWVARHIGDYVSTGGEKGHRWRGVDTLLLTTRGRKTGKLRRTALIYGRDRDRFLVVASRGGAEQHRTGTSTCSRSRRSRSRSGRTSSRLGPAPPPRGRSRDCGA